MWKRKPEEDSETPVGASDTKWLEELLEKTNDDDFTFAVPDFDNDGFEDYEDGEF